MTDEIQDPKTTTRWSINKKLFLSLMFFWVICLVGLYSWKLIDEYRIQSVSDTEKAAVVEAASKIVNGQTEAFLSFNARYLSWAVSTPLVNEEYDTISNLFNTLIKEQNFRQLLVAKLDGTIFVSTDKKYESTDLSKLFDDTVLEIDEVSIRSEEEVIKVAAPITDKTSKLGTLLIIYTKKDLSEEITAGIK